MGISCIANFTFPGIFVWPKALTIVISILVNYIKKLLHVFTYISYLMKEAINYSKSSGISVILIYLFLNFDFSFDRSTVF